MTHDWFAHLEEARNDQHQDHARLGCTTERVNNVERALTAGARRRARLPPGRQDGGRPDRRQGTAPARSSHQGETPSEARAARRRATTSPPGGTPRRSTASTQRSRGRVQRDPNGPGEARDGQAHAGTPGDAFGYLPAFERPVAGNRDEPAAIRSSRNGSDRKPSPSRQLVDRAELLCTTSSRASTTSSSTNSARSRKRRRTTDSGLRNPDRPDDAISYRQISDDELFEIARLVVAAEIAKIHTIEWTTQLLYDEPLYVGMNSNWSGLFKDDAQATRAAKLASDVTARIVSKLGTLDEPEVRQPALLGVRRRPRHRRHRAAIAPYRDRTGPESDGGINHFGSPFNFPGGVHRGLPAASAGAGHDRVPRARQCRTRSQSACR